MAIETTAAYDAATAQDVKEPVIVLAIDGLPYFFSTGRTFSVPTYDSGLTYDSGHFYDEMVEIGGDTMKPWIDRRGSSAVISQKLEQWDGKASVETLSIKLVDVNGQVSKLLAPGISLNEILNRKVKVFFGYRNISFPQDFIRIFSGYINEYKINQGAVVLNFTDPSSKRKQQIFNNATTTLSADITNSVTTIPLVSNTLLYQTILNGKGVNDPTVTIGIMIGDEIITYTNASIDIDGVHLNGVTRGALGTTASAHSLGDSVDMFIQLVDNPITIALKTMLSGWNGPCFTDITLYGILNTGAGIVADSITFEQDVDLIRDYGLQVGDFITLSGSPNVPNNDTFTIRSFINNNQGVVVAESGVLIQENPPTSTVAAFRSQFDVYPVTAGISLTTDEVLVSQFTYLRDTFIQFDFTMQIKSSVDNGKVWIETDLLKPIAGYSLTQGSRISMGLTHPPLATQLTKILDHNNVISPSQIIVNRGVNTRFFYNEVQFNYAFDIVVGDFLQSLVVEDADAQDRLNQVSTLTIDVKGLPAGANSETILKQRAQRILLRYRYSAETVDVQTKFGTGHTIDAGDIIVLTDKITNGVRTPVLQIPNTETGERGIYDRVMEVQERSVALSDANAKVKLLSNNGFSFTDRYAVISPSSLVDVGSSTTQFTIKESFGGRYPGQEFLKWTKYQGSRVRIHSQDFTRDGVSTFTMAGADPFAVTLNTPLSFTPQPDDVMTFADYDETSANSESLVKSTFTFLSRTGDVASGASSNVFTLQAGQGSGYMPGAIVYVMSPDGTTRFSPEVKILTVVGDTVTIGQIDVGNASDLGFTPQAGDFMKLGGFLDGGGSYRYV